MIETSKEWTAMFKEDDLFPESNVRLICNNNVVSTNNWSVTADAEEKSNSSVLLSEKNQLKESNSKIATLEWNYWILDGTYETPTESTKIDQFVSTEVSDKNGDFTQDVEIELKAPSSFIKKLMTIQFAPDISEYATQCKVTTGSKIKSNVFNDSEVYLYADTSNNATNTFKLSIQKWSMPYRRARVSELLVGARILFDKNKISQFNHERSCDLINSELPINDCSVNVLDIDGDFNVNDKNAKFYNVFEANSVFRLYYGFKFNENWEYVLADCFYIENIEHLSNSIETTFNLESNVSRMTQTFKSSDSINWKTYNEIINAISNKAQVSITNRVVNNDFCTYTKELLGFSLKQALRSEIYEIPMNEWLQQIACIAGGYIFRQPAGPLELRTARVTESDIVDTIPLINCFEYPEVEILGQVSNVILETTPLNDGQKDSPDTDIQIEVGGTKVTFPPYRYTLNVNSIGEELKAKNQIIIIGNSQQEEKMFVQEDGLHTAYMSWLSKFTNNVKKYTTNMRINPAWQIGDRISLEVKGGGYVTGFVVDISVEYAGYPKGDITILVV